MASLGIEEGISGNGFICMYDSECLGTPTTLALQMSLAQTLLLPLNAPAEAVLCSKGSCQLMSIVSGWGVQFGGRGVWYLCIMNYKYNNQPSSPTFGLILNSE
jgi:hypothetical protein